MTDINLDPYCEVVYETQANPNYIPAVDQWYSWTGGQSETHPFPSTDWNPDNGNHNGQPFQGHINEAFQVSQGNSANWFYRQVTPAVGTPTIEVATGEVCDVWMTWESPLWFPNEDGVGWDQPFVGLGRIAPTECETTYQQDHYIGARSLIDGLLVDELLTGPDPAEDHLVVTEWDILSTAACGDPTQHVITSSVDCDGNVSVYTDGVLSDTYVDTAQIDTVACTPTTNDDPPPPTTLAETGASVALAWLTAGLFVAAATVFYVRKLVRAHG